MCSLDIVGDLHALYCLLFPYPSIFLSTMNLLSGLYYSLLSLHYMLRRIELLDQRMHWNSSLCPSRSSNLQSPHPLPFPKPYCFSEFHFPSFPTLRFTQKGCSPPFRRISYPCVLTLLTLRPVNFSHQSTTQSARLHFVSLQPRSLVVPLLRRSFLSLLPRVDQL